MSSLPTIVFFNINGSGMGHMNRCLSYAQRLKDRANCVFFSLASAIEIIESFGYKAEYFVSSFWTTNTNFAWNAELTARFGLLLKHTNPDAIVFDGTWPYLGFKAALKSSKTDAKLVWSNRGLMKKNVAKRQPKGGIFDLIIQPGELGAVVKHESLDKNRTKLLVPPVCLLDNGDFLGRTAVRTELGLAVDGKYVLFSLGPGNLKDVSNIGLGLLRDFESRGFQVVWAQAPISVKDTPLPDSAIPLQKYPLARYMRGFDVFVGAAGYNTCCEIVQSGVPSLIVPNTQLADDQWARAQMVASAAPAVVNTCESADQIRAAVSAVLDLAGGGDAWQVPFDMGGAGIAADAILGLL